MNGVVLSGLPGAGRAAGAVSGLAPGAAPGQAQSRQEPAGAGQSFAAFLEEALARVEAQQLEAQAAAVRLAAGQAPDLAAVMLTSEKATLSLQFAIAVRNKVLEAYQEIMRMPL
ncbi:MAG: flagellar hook-basal body complex protein FliE [Firmicutes bacterium]|nr:flagellar hook-basal body complex protein FliE [Bacillota bacterium]